MLHLPSFGVSAKNTKYFAYHGNYIYDTISYTGASNAGIFDTTILNGQNRVDSLNYLSSVWIQNHYQYDSLGEVISNTFYTYNSNNTDTYKWQNGDMISYTPGGAGYSYIYGYYDTIYNIGNINASIQDLE